MAAEEEPSEGWVLLRLAIIAISLTVLASTELSKITCGEVPGGPGRG
jgi:hypothetical protein